MNTHSYQDERPAIYIWRTAQALTIGPITLLEMIHEPPVAIPQWDRLDDAYDYMRLIINAIAPTVQERYWLDVWITRFKNEPSQAVTHRSVYKQPPPLQASGIDFCKDCGQILSPVRVHICPERPSKTPRTCGHPGFIEDGRCEQGHGQP